MRIWRGQLVLRAPAIQPLHHALIRDALARLQLSQAGANVLVFPAIGRNVHGDHLGCQVRDRLLAIVSESCQTSLYCRIELDKNRCLGHETPSSVIMRPTHYYFLPSLYRSEPLMNYLGVPERGSGQQQGVDAVQN